MNLRQALNVQRGDIVAFTGAGGKTSALFRLGRELAAEGWRVIGTTTTRIGVDELALAPGELQIDGPLGYRPAAISRALNQHGFIFLYGHARRDKAIGVAPEVIEALVDAVDSDAILIEADGSRRMPFKAPFPHEPVIPVGTTLVVPMVGFDVIGQPLNDEHVYNPDAMIERYGFAPGGSIKAPWIASVLRDTELGLKAVPSTARVVALLNKVPTTGFQKGRARMIARMILREQRVGAVALGAVQGDPPVNEVQRRVAAIVLAGGLSSRMGQSKVLLPWDGRPVIRVIVDRLKRLRLDDIVVVTGHLAKQVGAALDQEPVRLAHNKRYRAGEMLSSLQTGLQALGPEISACLIVLGDQPQIDNRIVHEVLNAYAEGKGTIVAPSYHHRRGHPILIDRQYWQELLDLPDGSAPRDVINTHADATHYVEVDTDSVLRDMDTPEDYQQERRRAGLG
ncbi:MAG: putative selenium-dependent hydroxylase accessory protein YqeC [Anaerolineae bacterium]|nr:putative selenium-dependent hydroxylase accessory protein YqeC [Anaerolineae bacterium]